MGTVYFGTSDGKILQPMSEIKEMDLTSEEDAKELQPMVKALESFECDVDIKIVGHENLNLCRYIASGFDQGRYNGMTLREEGHLSPDNGWIKE